MSFQLYNSHFFAIRLHCNLYGDTMPISFCVTILLSDVFDESKIFKYSNTISISSLLKKLKEHLLTSCWQTPLTDLKIIGNDFDGKILCPINQFVLSLNEKEKRNVKTEKGNFLFLLMLHIGQDRSDQVRLYFISKLK